MASFDLPVTELKNGLGAFHRRLRALPQDPRGRVPVFCQELDAAVFSLAFEAGSPAYEVLANDQSRFSPPRSLPPIVDLEAPGDPGNEADRYVITRYAYSDGAFHLLEDLLAGGHVFAMNELLELGWSLAQVLAFLHRHQIVHGQWNARSVIAIPSDGRQHPLREKPAYRFELFNTGLCFVDPAAIPVEYVERGYYPPEAFVSAHRVPDYGALDLRADVYCFAAFLRDLMQRSCSSEELPSQATRILVELQKEANRRGWKASPESLRQKELEILDHLYTIRARTESMIQAGLRPRDERCTARHFLDLTSDLHAKATTYLDQLFMRGFEPVNVFDGDLLHYTTFTLSVSPSRINSYEDARVVLTGSDLPRDLVRVTLNESHERIQVTAAQRDRIELTIECGLASGDYKVSINNRRTNGTLSVVAPTWESVDPADTPLPWEGFAALRLTVRGRQLPRGVRYSLWPARADDGAPAEQLAVIAVRALGGEEDGGAAGAEVVAGEGGEESVVLEVSPGVPPAAYELAANFLPTGLAVRIADRLPEPVVDSDGLERSEIKNHRAWRLRLRGRDFHPSMVIDLGADAPAGLTTEVESSREALLAVPVGFAAGDYRLRLNWRDTGVRLRVRQPSWAAVRPAALRLRRRQTDPVEVTLVGEGLPALGDGDGYALVGRRGQPLAGAVLDATEVRPESEHKLVLAPDLARSRPRIRFAERDTGLRLRVRRQVSAAAVAAVGVLLLACLAALGAVLRERFAPRVTAVQPAAVFNFGPQAVEVEGAHLAALELVTEAGVPAATVPVAAVDGAPGRYRFAAAGLPAGAFRLRPIGPWFAAAPTDLALMVRSPRLQIEPGVLHRFDGGALVLRAAAGFDPTTLRTLALVRPGAGEALAELALSDGRAEVPGGRFAAADEGEYEVALDGAVVREPGEDGGAVPLTVRIVGPRLEAVSPNPVSLDATGRIAIEIEGRDLGGAPWVGLAPAPAADAVEVAAPVVQALEPLAARQFAGAVPVGRYRVLLGPRADAAEPVPELELQVLPQPEVVAVEPRQLSPGRETVVTFAGINLAGLEQISLHPAGADGAPIEVPLDPQKLTSRDDLEASYAYPLALPSGSWVVEPAAATLSIDVFDDCRRLVERFENERDAEALLRCLRTERPPDDVVRRAADLLFDRGWFAEARELYQRAGGDLIAAFRTALVDAYVSGQPVPMLQIGESDRTAPYAVAAARLGWAALAPAEFPADVALPWELEFARGVSVAEPAAAVDALQQAAAKKTAACRGHEVAPFAAIADRLARARLELAIDRVRAADHGAARRLLREELIDDADAWSRLAAEDQARALFWHGHLQLWYGGDSDAAAAALERAALLDAGAASDLARAYAAAFAAGSGGDGIAAPPVAGWEGAFVRVFRYYGEVRENPNYNLLTERQGSGVYLPESERRRSRELHGALAELEALPPVDPFAHFALLFYMRNAQRVAWPSQQGGAVASNHRARLKDLALAAELEPLREFYLLLGDVEPYDEPQIAVFTRSEKREKLERITGLLGLALPASFHTATEDLKKKFSAPSVIWSLR